MSTHPCLVCGHPISKCALVCPNCGAVYKQSDIKFNVVVTNFDISFVQLIWIFFKMFWAMVPTAILIFIFSLILGATLGAAKALFF